METKQQRYMKGKNKVSIAIDSVLFEQFKEKLAQDNLTQKEVLETAIYQYINGIMKLNKK